MADNGDGMRGTEVGGPLAVHTLLAGGGKAAFGRKQGHGDAGKVPVAVLTPPPARPPALTGRRPVVAVLDTGVDPTHPWLTGTPDDPVVRDAAVLGWTPPADPGNVVSPEAGYHGHATFLAGIVLQVAPMARLLSVRVMNDSGLVPRDASLAALSWLSRLARGSDPGAFPDVVCTAYGYYPDASDDGHKEQLRAALWELADRGVLIVASAGNDGIDQQVLPAAFATDAPKPATSLISVGATNPDGAYSHYSNYGNWVTHQATGTGVISIMERFDGGMLPPPMPEYSHGSAIDPNDFRAGFARWSGTSFAAAHIAGLLASALSADPTLADVSREATVKRAAVAVAAIKEYRTRT
jgi:subtilisin family serine protease